MKKFKLIALALVSVLLLTGCNLIPSKTTTTTTKEAKPAKGNCVVFDCIKQLDTKADLETVTKVMGFEGEKINEGNGYTTYKWVIDSDKNEALQAAFYSTSTSISITFSDEDIKNSKVDFSKYDEIKSALNNREKLTYDDIKSKFNAEGTLIEKTSFSTKYRWVNEKGGYLNATFGNTTGACSMIIGRI
ncbi:MAG: hypothetical protein IJ097_02530 [Bacilli bacterium]|nr:hypothetical protein [Bacilli bacterium]